MDFKVKDIAAMLNLSPATVSLVINKKPGISQTTRNRVYEALEQLGCHDVLDDIHTSKKAIELIIFQKKSKPSDNQYFPQVFSGIMKGIDVQAKELGYNLMISYIDEENINGQIVSLTQRRSDGILLLGTDMEQKYLNMFTKGDIPVVVLDNYYEMENVDCVTINNEQGVFHALKHLQQMGHTKIGYIHSAENIHNFEERYYGYLRAMEICQLDVNYEHIFRLSSDNKHMQSTLKAYFEDCKSLPTAFFTDNDILAIHTIKALNELNIQVPDGISIIGFDNMPLSEMLEPPLTTIDIPKYQMGSMAVKRLIEVIQSNFTQPCKIEIGTRLVTRKSVAKPH